MRMLTSGLHTETLATDAASFPVAQRDLLHDECEDASDGKGVRLPAREHRAEAVVAQDLDGRLTDARRRARTGRPAHAP